MSQPNPFEQVRNRESAATLRAQTLERLYREDLERQFCTSIEAIPGNLSKRNFQDCFIQPWNGHDYVLFSTRFNDGDNRQKGAAMLYLFNEQGEHLTVFGAEEAQAQGESRRYEGGRIFEASDVSEISSEHLKDTMVLARHLDIAAKSNDPWYGYHRVHQLYDYDSKPGFAVIDEIYAKQREITERYDHSHKQR